jgi:hypothetical protein
LSAKGARTKRAGTDVAQGSITRRERRPGGGFDDRAQNAANSNDTEDPDDYDDLE